MCEKCAEINETIAHYQRIASAITDQLTLDRISEKIREMDAQKAALHPESANLGSAVLICSRMPVDRAMQLRHLEQAEGHIVLGERHVAEQERRIAERARLGRDTTEGQRLLNNFFALQLQHIQHRDRILREMGMTRYPRHP